VIKDSDHLGHPGQPESSTILRKPEISQFTMIFKNDGKYLPQQTDANMLDHEHEGTTNLWNVSKSLPRHTPHPT